MTFYLDPPTDSQVAYIYSLCEQVGLERPGAIASKQEASRMIEELKAHVYNPDDYAYPFRVGAGSTVLAGDPDWKDSDSHAEQVWHVRYDGE